MTEGTAGPRTAPRFASATDGAKQASPGQTLRQQACGDGPERRFPLTATDTDNDPLTYTVHEHFRPPGGRDLGLRPERVALTPAPWRRGKRSSGSEEGTGAVPRGLVAPDPRCHPDALRIAPTGLRVLRCTRARHPRPPPTPGRAPGHPTRHWPSQRIRPPRYIALPGAPKPKISSYSAPPAFSTRTSRSRPGRAAPGVRSVAPRPKLSTA